MAADPGAVGRETDRHPYQQHGAAAPTPASSTSSSARRDSDGSSSSPYYHPYPLRRSTDSGLVSAMEAELLAADDGSPDSPTSASADYGDDGEGGFRRRRRRRQRQDDYDAADDDNDYYNYGDDDDHRHPRPTRFQTLRSKYRTRPSRFYGTLALYALLAFIYARILLYGGLGWGFGLGGRWGRTLRPVGTLLELLPLERDADADAYFSALSDLDLAALARQTKDSLTVDGMADADAEADDADADDARFDVRMSSGLEAMRRAVERKGGDGGIDPRGLEAVRAWNDWADAALRERAERKRRRKEKEEREQEEEAKEEERERRKEEEEEEEEGSDKEDTSEMEAEKKEGMHGDETGDVEGRANVKDDSYVKDDSKNAGDGEHDSTKASRTTKFVRRGDDGNDAKRQQPADGKGGSSSGGKRSKRDPSRLAPLLVMLTCCTLFRACISLALDAAAADDDDDDLIRRAAVLEGRGGIGSGDDDPDSPFSLRAGRNSGGVGGLGGGGGLRLRSSRTGGGGNLNGLAASLVLASRDARSVARAAARARYRRLVSNLNAARAENGQRPISAESLRLVLSARNFTGNDYDDLLRFDEENGPALESLTSGIGATDEEIARCPDRTIQNEDDDLMRGGGSGAASTAESASRRNCAVCLEPYEVGDRVRTIPCFHTFHCDCIDPWLGRKAECPVCKHPALG